MCDVMRVLPANAYLLECFGEGERDKEKEKERECVYTLMILKSGVPLYLLYLSAQNSASVASAAPP